MFGTSPNISPDASSTTGPESIAMRAASTGLPVTAFFPFSSHSARWIASAACTARSASFLRHRIAEQCHQPVAELLGDFAAHFHDRRGGHIEISANQKGRARQSAAASR
jgi:hypothetical protein